MKKESSPLSRADFPSRRNWREWAPCRAFFFGLPGEASGALIMGFLRKDLAVGMLMPLGLTFHQLVVASMMLAMFFPCIAT